MALSGNFSNYGYAGYSNLGLYISWSASQNVSGNYSDVKLDVYAQTYNISVNTRTVTVKVFGVEKTFTSNSISDSNSTWDKQKLGTITVRVNHNSDGSKKGNIEVTYPINATIGGTAVSSMKATSSEITLDTIPRASSFTISGTELGSAVSVAISRASTSFTHKVEWKYGESDYTEVISNAATSASFTPSISYASQYPNTTSGTLTVRVTTFNGTTQIGNAVTNTATLKIPASVIPTMDNPTATLVDLTSGKLGVYCQGYSKTTIKINNANGIHGSTIKSYSITGGGFSSNSSTLNTDVINSSGTITFTCVITDSRGRTNTKQVPITVYAYKPPTLTVTAKRCKSDKTLSTSGTYVLITPKYVIQSVNGKNGVKSGPTASGNGNTATGSTSGTSFLLGSASKPFLVSSTYDITVTITDKVSGPISTTVTIPTDIRILNIKRNGKGVAFGGFAMEDDVLQVNWDLVVDGDIYSETGTINTSDREKKKEFTDFDERYKEMFMDLKPQLFKFKNGTSNRFHSGFVSQDVEKSLLANGLTPLDFAGFCKDEVLPIKINKDGTRERVITHDENGNQLYDYSLRYEEFIALNTYMIQQCLFRIEELEKQVEKYKKQLNQEKEG